LICGQLHGALDVVSVTLNKDGGFVMNRLWSNTLPSVGHVFKVVKLNRADEVLLCCENGLYLGKVDLQKKKVTLTKQWFDKNKVT